MIAALIIWLYVGALFHMYGAGTLALLRRWLGAGERGAGGLPLTIIVGMAQVTALVSFLSLVIPLGALAFVIILIIGIILAWLARLRISWSLRMPRRAEIWTVLVVALAVVFCLEAGTTAPSNPDTQAYHAQTIRWIEEFRAVPGLGNLYGRLAYNSSWLVLNAAFSFAFLHLRSFHVLAGLMFLVSVLEFLPGLRGLAAREFSRANWMRALFLAAAFWIFRGEISSPGTDLPAILLTWILISRMVEYESSGVRDRTLEITLAMIPPLMIVLKLSAAPIALLTVYMLLRLLMRKDAIGAAALIALSALTLAPWIGRSLVLSGYPVYLYPQIDVIAPDWKIPAPDVEAVRNGILGWARLPQKNWGEALRMPASAWIPEWLSLRTPNQLLILVLAAVAPISLLPRAGRRYAAVVLSVYAAMLVWFLGAPNWRFGYGVVFGLAAFVLAAALSWAGGRLTERQGRLVGGAIPMLLTAYLGLTIAVVFDAGTLVDRLVLPLDYAASRAVACEQHGIRLYCGVATGSCGYSSFPCVPGISESTRPRGDGFQDGFYSVDLSESAP
jgi:hypothetical protein